MSNDVSYKGTAFAARWSCVSPAHRRRWAIATAKSCRTWSGWPDQWLHAVAAERGRGHEGRRPDRRLQQDAAEHPQVVPQVRRPPLHRAPALGAHGCLCRDDPDFPFAPGVHVNYQETVLRVRDGLPKLRDVPKELGGSGEPLPE